MALGTRRTAYYIGLVVVTTALFTVVYNTGMAALENRPQPLYRSLEVVVQSFTTTGYGEDAPWSSPVMNGLVITMQLAGIGLILAAVDVFAVPWLRNALTATAPEASPDAQNHVVICGHTPRTDALVSELEARGQEYVLVEPDQDRALDLHESGYDVMVGDPEDTDTLHAAAIDDSAAVVADVSDDANASIALTARDAAADVRIVTLVEDASLARYHHAAGADDVLSPRQLLGRALANRTPAAVTTDVADGVTIGDDLELAELTVEDGSPFADEPFSEARLREEYGVNVIGAWSNGAFEPSIDPTTRLTAGTRLLVTGPPDEVERLGEATAGPVRAHGSQRIVLVGFGDSGEAAYDALSRGPSTVTVLDVVDDEGVDVVGDARDPAVLEDAGVPDADALLLAVGDDRTAIFVTLIARELNESLQIVVRANEEADVAKLYRAGADYVQSLATVSGRMLASTIFDDETVLSYDTQINVVALPAAGLAGKTLAEADVRAETGCTVVAIHRDDERITDLDPTSTTFRAEDTVVLAGTDEAITNFERRFTE